MAQRINFHWNNSFVNWTRLPLLCEKFGAMHTPNASGSYGSLLGT